MSKRERNVQIKMYVTEDEKEQLQAKMTEAGYSTFSGYARKMLLDGHVNKVDFSDLRKLNRELGNLNRNLHQIYYAAEKTKSLHESDYRDVVKSWEKARDLINRYFYRIIRSGGEAYQPMAAGSATEDEDGDYEDLGD